MEVQLLSYTPNAMDLLIFTKQTRLNMTPGLMDDINKWPIDRKLRELKYMANTIPSSWEFVDYTFLITGVTRAFTHQFVRTRTASFAQQTMRLLPMEQFEYLAGPSVDATPARQDIYYDAMKKIQIAYDDLIAQGAEIEDARGVLPTNILTNIVAKFTLRGLADLWRGRSGVRVQDEYRQVLNAMVDTVLQGHPWAEMFIKPKLDDSVAELQELAKLARADNIDMSNKLQKIADKLKTGGLQ